MATFHKQPRGFPTCNTYSEIHPSSESSLSQSFTRCTRRSIKLKRRLQQLRFSWCLRVTSVYRAHNTRHVTSTVQKLIKGLQRTGLNRHRRGYATKEAGSVVHFPVSGPIGLARSQKFYIYFFPTSSSLIITSYTSAVLRSYFITTGTIALSIAYGPILVSRRNSRNLVKQTYHMHLGINQFLKT